VDTNVEESFKEATEERRIRDVTEARTLFNRFETDNQLRSSTYAQVRNQLEGGRPFDPALLERQGASWQTNVNFGDARAARDRTLLPYWKMVHDVPHKVAVQVESNAPDADRQGIAMAEAFDKWLDDWGADYFTQYMQFAASFVNFGPGAVSWGDKDNPRFKAVNVQRLYFPKNAKMSPDEWEVLAFTREMTASELWGKIRTPKAKKQSEYVGWNEQAIKAAITWCKDGQAWDGLDFTKVQDDLVNNDLAITSQYSPIEVVHLYVKQFSGKIGCYIFPKLDTKAEFLYRNEKYCDNFREVLGVAWYDIGSDAMVHSIKGFGIKNYHFSILLNRIKSRICDGLTIQMALNFTRGDGFPDEAPPVENYGPVNVFPTGLTQITTYPQFSQGGDVIDMLERNQSENNALYREQRKQIGDTETATQANILAAMAGELSEASASIYLAQIGENVFEQCFQRLRRKGNNHPDAKKFVKRCREKGVPDEVIFNAEIKVKTGATAGLANPAIRAMKLQQTMGMLRGLPGFNERWFAEQIVANEFGANAVNKALLPEGENSAPAQRRAAMQENGDFGQGMPLPVDPSDAHVEHIDEHLKPIEQMMVQYKQSGQFNKEGVPALLITIDHTNKHLEYLKNDQVRREAYRILANRFTQVQALAMGIMNKLNKEAQQAQMNGAAPMVPGGMQMMN
jgi:hypothetical protein